MYSLVIKDVPEELHERLKTEAAKHHRSLTNEALTLLKLALHIEEKKFTKITLPVKGQKFLLTDDWLDAAKREGRK